MKNSLRVVRAFLLLGCHSGGSEGYGGVRRGSGRQAILPAKSRPPLPALGPQGHQLMDEAYVFGLYIVFSQQGWKFGCPGTASPQKKRGVLAV